MVQPADIYVLAGVVAIDSEMPTLRALAEELLIDHTLAHRALKRAESVSLFSVATKRVHLPNFEEFLVHASRFVAPARLGAILPGIPAAWAAKPMSGFIRESSGDLPPVWPSADGRMRGQSLEPLHPAAIAAVEGLPRLGELLSVIDSLRAGDLRVRQVAGQALRKMLHRNSVAK